MNAPAAPHTWRAPALLACAALLASAVVVVLAQGPPPSGAPTFQVQVPLVIEDVVVLDSHNQPVHGLKASDFTITDDGKPVTPGSFDEHAFALPSAATAQPAVEQAASAAPLPPNTFTNRNAIPAGAPLNILLFDALNTPTVAQVQARQQMIKFLTTVAPGTPVAIYGLSAHLYLLQGFTTSPAILRAAIQGAGGGKTSPLLNQSSGGGPGLDQEAVGAYADLASGNGELQGALLSFQLFQQQIQTYQDQERTQLTLQAFGQLARSLSILPGRKNVIWFSGSFPLDIVPTALQSAAALGAGSSSGSDANIVAAGFSSASQSSASALVRNMDDQLRRAQIAVYPVDARGLFTDQTMSASSNANPAALVTAQQANSMARGGPSGSGPGTGSISMASDAVSNLAGSQSEEHASMLQMADETGGKAFYNNGDLAAEALSAMDFGSNYYSITYTPPGGKWDGKTHRVEIKVDQPGLHLSYRRRYFADAPDDSHSQPAPHAGPMQAAMMHGAPEADGLVFDVSATVADNPSGQLARGSKPDPKLMQPPYKTCSLTARLDIHTLQMTPDANGDQTGNIEFVMLVYDANGSLVNQSAVGGHLVLPAERYQQVLQSGLVIKPAIDVPARGNYFIRVGFHDPASDRVGAVEFPVTALAATQAVAVSQAPPAQP